MLSKFSTPLIAIFALVFVLSSFSYAASDGELWTRVNVSRLPTRGQRAAAPEKSLTFRLDRAGLVKTFAKLSKAAGPVVIKVPMPDGSLQRFRIEELPILAPHLAADFPDWKTLRGTGIDDPTADARFDWTSAGFHGYVLTARGTVYIDPVQENDRENYYVYYKHEYGAPAAGKFSCSTDDVMSKLTLTNLNASPRAVNFSFGSAIKTYRLAIATTAEWSRSTTTSTEPQAVRTAALAALTTSVNRLDGIFRRELGVTFQLVNPSITNEAANIIYDNPETDPYDNTDGVPQLELNQGNIDARVGNANYDVGHLYGTGGGGIAASPSVCTEGKAGGYSARAGFLGDPFTVDYVAHEIGHQFGASHTYNNTDPDGACTTRSAEDAFEVASGSTIMSYVGICNIRNLQEYVDTGTPNFHIRSLTQMIANTEDVTGGGACGSPSGTNSVPTVSAGPNFTIPRLTPFVLTANATDADAADAANLLYSWEEYDLSPSSTGQLGSPAFTYDVDTDGVLRPLFRVYSPVADRSRTFPSLPFILNTANNLPAGSNAPPLNYTGTHPTGLPGAVCGVMIECVVGESLPSIARTMNFRVSVRDRRGGIADAGMTVTTVNTTGPFQITSQNLAPAAWAIGSNQTVTWDVVGSNAAPISASGVNILLSTDGGQTFPVTLLANTPNDGTESITVPGNPTTQARVKVEAAGKIFFDINNANFSITGGAPVQVTVTGTVTDPRGRGFATTVVLIDTAGNRQTATTSSFGMYSFAGLAAGANYRISIASRRYKFTAFQGIIAANSVVNFNGTE